MAFLYLIFSSLFYWFSSGTITFIAMYLHPNTNIEMPEFKQTPTSYLGVCMVLGGFILPTMAINAILKRVDARNEKKHGIKPRTSNIL